jgi:hypothetical protein
MGWFGHPFSVPPLIDVATAVAAADEFRAAAQDDRAGGVGGPEPDEIAYSRPDGLNQVPIAPKQR